MLQSLGRFSQGEVKQAQEELNKQKDLLKECNKDINEKIREHKDLGKEVNDTDLKITEFEHKVTKCNKDAKDAEKNVRFCFVLTFVESFALGSVNLDVLFPLYTRVNVSLHRLRTCCKTMTGYRMRKGILVNQTRPTTSKQQIQRKPESGFKDCRRPRTNSVKM